MSHPEPLNIELKSRAPKHKIRMENYSTAMFIWDSGICATDITLCSHDWGNRSLVREDGGDAPSYIHHRPYLDTLLKFSLNGCDFCLLGCDALHSGRYITAFWLNLLPPLSTGEGISMFLRNAVTSYGLVDKYGYFRVRTVGTYLSDNMGHIHIPRRQSS
jgi:hypothetical protein